MATQQDVLSVLKTVNASFLGAKGKHPKYRLPNGLQVTIPSTASDNRSWDNTLSLVRREIKDTNPEIALMREGRRVPKSRNVTIGDALTLKAERQPDGNEAPSQPAIVDPNGVVRKLSRKELREKRFYQPPPEPPPPPRPTKPPPSYRNTKDCAKHSKVFTLSADQLSCANQVLTDHGQAAMDRYIEECRGGLAVANKAIQIARKPEVPVPTAHKPETYTSNEDAMLKDFIERAKTELSSAQARIAAAKKAIEEDEIRSMSLESLIQSYDKMSLDLQEALGYLPPVESVPEPVKVFDPAVPELVQSAKPGSGLTHKPTMRKMVKYLDPQLRGKHFTAKDFIEMAEKHYPGTVPLNRPSVIASLGILAKDGVVRRVGYGLFER